ncbi:tRNA pseudouridine synthase D [Cutaneotrichosporon oleaginosum]|uniref:tRNA pseudouridine synthase D n=1 Tax=Cutaneotrichosporon oleaginosum TaxID=879819 RepID=A0A0J0XVB6_9TREE|nr:tRNA pseudouridine synthase D [Cutaneotrichosporon oleaginosum]KLT45003.1 tRNA pseudouridine synthase D [Cutaneotrichosporon oleaginosum]TXT09691.1 hypothetical protein COLE_03625 [Cutaneotrichosporon oleaginosum]
MEVNQEGKRALAYAPEPSAKRPRASPGTHALPQPLSRLGLTPQPPVLPSSLELATGTKADLSARKGFVGEPEVGILAYLGDPAYAGIQGVIKQRFTDFLVNEISLAGEIVHLVDIGAPESEAQAGPSNPKPEAAEPKGSEGEGAQGAEGKAEGPLGLAFDHPDWPATATAALREHFSDETIAALHTLLVEGKDVRRPLDAGWGGPRIKMTEEEEAMNVTVGQGRDRGRGRQGGRGQSQGGGGGVNKREVVQLIAEKEARGAAHKAIRELFKGRFESLARDDPSGGQQIVIRWAQGGQRQPAKPRSTLPRYIHFTLQKTNRETMDCLGHISRVLKVHNKDLSVCGTKDKRAVTVQRVSFKRGTWTLENVWRAVNGVKAGRRTEEEAVTRRGDRGTRIGDLCYAQKPLDLGMLKGNHFTITLRNVQTRDPAAVDAAMESIRDNGFINYYGMQRFGTSTVPTHVTGLLLLQQRWGDAVDSILSLREGEHPECTRGRLAWLEDEDYKKALEIMPRRSVAERAIWEHWRKGNLVKDKLGALTAIPRNLRSMYVHAYQSYIWNLVVSARIKMSNTSALPGDLVYADGGDDEDEDGKARSAATREVKQLTEADVANYRLTDVVMPLPGWHIEYPGGALGKLYEDVLAADGLNPHKMRREQREYSLPGSYRKIVHKPANVTWAHVRYTDPDVPLTQADEDRLLGLNVPAKDDPEGKFGALIISWSLGTSSYATMALREITRQETSAWHQTGLTAEGEDQAHKGAAEKGEGEVEGVDAMEE